MSFLSHLDQTLPEASRWILFDGLKHATEMQLYDAILQLEEEVLRPMHAAGKKDSKGFQFFCRIKDMLYQAGEAEHLLGQMKERLDQERQWSAYLSQQLAEKTRLLDRFETIEDLSHAGLLEITMERVRRAMQERREAAVTQAQATAVP